MKIFTKTFLFLLILFSPSILFCQYKGVISYFERFEIQEFTMDEEGNIVFSNVFPVIKEPMYITIAPNREFLIVSIDGWTEKDRLELFSIDRDSNIHYEKLLESENFWCNPPTFSPDSKYMITLYYREEISLWTINLFKIEEGYNFVNTGSFIDIDANNLNRVHKLTQVTNNGTFLGNNDNEMCVFKFDKNTETISFTGQRINISPINSTGDTILSPNERYCAHIGSSLGCILTIEPDGTVNNDVHFLNTQDLNPNQICFSPNSSYLYISYVGGKGSIESHQIFYNGENNIIQREIGYSVAEPMDITPDGKFIILANRRSIYGQWISIFRLYEDGTFQKLDKDIYLQNTSISDIKLIPPYVTSTNDEIWEMYK